MQTPVSHRRSRTRPSGRRAWPPLVGRSDLADQMASPVLVDALAAAIRVYGGLDSATGNHPLDIVDLAPGHGVLAVRLLRNLQASAQDGIRCRPVRLHLCLGPAEFSRLIDRHVELRLAYQHGVVVQSAWDPARSDTPATRQVRPMVVIALGYFHRLPTHLGATHYGQWHHATIERAPRDEQGDWPLTYRWSSHSRPPEDAHLQGMRRYYLDRLGSVAVGLPHAGMRVVQRIDRDSGGRYLLLAADHGAASLADIQTGALAPPHSWRDGASALPVNFHALERAQPHAHVVNVRGDSHGLLLHMALAGEPDDAPLRRIADRLGEGGDDPLAMRELAGWLPPELPLAMRLAHLRRCAFDPRVLMYPPGATTADRPDLVARQAWGQALQRCRRLAADEPDIAIAQAVGMWATHLGLYRLAAESLQPIATQLAAQARIYLSVAQLHVGDMAGALESAGPLAPTDPPDCWRAYLHDCSRRWGALPWYQPALARDGDLCLQPLEAHHAHAWLEQYRDPHIGIMTRLPELTTIEATQAWIAEQRADPARAVFAVMHVEHGFVGSVGYQRAGDSGYYHFWIGTDYQGNNLGRRAGRLLYRQAASAGIGCLYTSAYLDNFRSLGALTALGFLRMPVEALAPDDDLAFFAMSLAKEHSPCAEGLRVLCRAIASPMRFFEASDAGLDPATATSAATI